MDSATDRVNKQREERNAKEKARLDKLRELNLEKYNKNGDPYKNSTSYLCNKAAGAVNKDFNVNSTMEKPASVPTTKTTVNKGLTKPESVEKLPNTDRTVTNINHLPKSEKKVANSNVNVENKQNFAIRKADSATANLKQSLAVTNDQQKLDMGRKPMIPESSSQTTSQSSVFERLCEPKLAHSHVNDGKKPHTDINDVKTLHTNPHYMRKDTSESSDHILNKEHTVFDHNEKVVPAPFHN